MGGSTVKLSRRGERQRAAIVPLHKNLSFIVHEVHLTLGAGKNGMMGIVHSVQPDAGAGGYCSLRKFTIFLSIIVSSMFCFLS